MHLGINFLSITERVAHFSLALLELFPLLGLFVALVDRLVFNCPLRIIEIDQQDPYKAGQAQAKACAKELHFVIERVLPIYKAIVFFRGKNPYEEAKKLEGYIPQPYIEEMKGLAEASGIAYDEILVANTIMDTLDLYGCSLCAICKDRETGQISRELATNYFHSRGRGHKVVDVERSFWRYDQLEACNPDFEKGSLLKMLRKVNYRNTINTVIFDVNQREIQLAIGSEFSANRPLKRFTAKQLFGDSTTIDGPFEALLARNLDWPMAIFAPLTRLFIRRERANALTTVSISLPGVIGGYSGMNQMGLSLATCIVPSIVQEGISSQLLFRMVLEQAKSVHEALKIIEKSKAASAVNLMIAAGDGIVQAEIDPARKSIGAISVTLGK